MLIKTARYELPPEDITLHGLGMPASSKSTFISGEYAAEFEGVITSELVLFLFGNTRIRIHGLLNIKDNEGNAGCLELSRAGDITIKINDQPAIYHSVAKITSMNMQLPVPQPA